MPRILKLERMEILGFKSFYGRTRFDFPEGITAVVGPNGCGKSNIGDAISWVLGEQKASSLRSDRMEDVIFNGSEGRRPLGMAEVSLHFINLLADGNGGAAGNGHQEASNTVAGGNGHAVVADPAADSSGPEDRQVPIAEAAESALPADAEDMESGFGSKALRITGIEEIPGEVVVTRRIYRSGESEYILNGERCRLKDIQDLLARTDIGSRLYSTIEQGKIDQVLAARPKDRRAMFEEAAGILGYRSKRRQAELKLEAAQANLLRVHDIVVEVERQMQSLRRQASKARRYQRLLDELRQKRLLLAQLRLAAADQDRRSTDDALESLRAEEVAAATALAGHEAELEALRLRLEEGEAAARVRREEIHAFDLEADRIQERLRSGAEQAKDLEARIAEGAAELEGLQGRLAERESRLEEAIRGAAEVEERVRSAASSVAAVSVDDSARVRSIEACEAELEAARTAHLDRIDRISSLTQKRTALEEQARLGRADLDKTLKETEDLSARRERVGQEIASLEIEIAEGRKREEIAARDHEAAVAAAREAGSRLAAAEKGAEELKGRAAILEERLASLLEMERQHAGFSEGVGDILKGSAGFAPRGIVGDRLQIPRGLERAVEATLAELLEAVVVGGDEEAGRGIDHLRSTARGRVSFVTEEGPGAEGPTHERTSGDDRGGASMIPGRLSEKIGGVPEGPIRRILDGTVVVQDLEDAFRRRAANPARAYVTPQGDVVRLDGSVTGGDGRALSHWLLQRRIEKEEITRRAAEVAAALDEAEGGFRRLRDEEACARERLERLAAAVQDERHLGLERDLRLQQGRVEAERTDRSLPILLDEGSRLQRDIASCGEENASLSASSESLESERRSLEERIASMSAGLQAMRSDLEAFRRASSEARETLASAEQRLQSLGRERGALEEGIQEVRAASERRLREAQDQKERVALIRVQEGDLETRRLVVLQGRAEAAARDEAAHAGLAYERGLLHAREQEVREARAAQVSVRDRQQQHELRRARVEADLEHLERTCRDELGTTIEALRESPAVSDEAPGLADLETEVQRIRSDIETLGPVNLMAVEQQGDLEERFTFLTAQRGDLEEAIASLRETIRTINREARDRFQSAFEAIQQHFQDCFKTLFAGGKAELRLAEGEDDVLEAGIEIVAQPPGKRLQKIALLSGGEKALTAVALLVSLFRYRPSPFCVLDEVDAPLDEANVGRFTQLLQQLRSDTQFIIITHNRKSMEAADLLYGVTMEEPGVSKILPLRFE